jgi:hypothetical protein
MESIAHKHNIIDLTKSSPRENYFSDEDDENAFGVDANLRNFYKCHVRRLRQNDPNFRLLELPVRIFRSELSLAVHARIGMYMWQSKYIKTLILSSCSLSEFHMELLFGKIARQKVTNTYISEDDILGKLGVNEQILVSSILEGVTSFSNLVKVDVSCNSYGAHGLDVLAKSLAGSPIKHLDISSCGLDGISPLRGLQHCSRLKELDISANTVRADDVDTVKMLMDNKHFPKLRSFFLNRCGITDNFVVMISPALMKNESLRFFFMTDHYPARELPDRAGVVNEVGARGVAALSKVIHDTSTFEKTLASNHTLWKVCVSNEDFDHVLWGNLSYQCHGNHVKHRVAWHKYIMHFVETTEVADMAPFMEVNINLIPIVLSIVNRDVSKDVALSACYKIWSCKMFRERIYMTSQVTSLQARNDTLETFAVELACSQASANKRRELLQNENSRLKEEIAVLLASSAFKLTSSCKKTVMVEEVEESIGKRVKNRNTRRKRERSDKSSNGNTRRG